MAVSSGMMTRIFLIYFASLCALAGCSSGSDDTGSGDTAIAGETCEAATGDCSTDDDATEAVATTRTVSGSGGASGLNANYDADTNLFTMTVLDNGVQMSRFSTADYGQMLAMRDALGIHNAYFAQGNGTQAVVYSGGLAGQVTQTAGFERTGDTELPLTGSATMNGQYAGFTSTRRINGDARLSVDFAGGAVSGSIRNRVFRQRPDNRFDATNPLSTVLLESTNLRADGTFSGATGGGQIVNGQQTWNPATGTYAGLIGGPTGGEGVGRVTIVHNAPSGAQIEEVGAFFVK